MNDQTQTEKALTRPRSPEEARDEIAAMLIDAATALFEEAEKKSRLSPKRKDQLRLAKHLSDIGERIAALTY